MRRLVGMLRADAPDSLAPQPRLADLPTLLMQVRDAGLPVDLRVDGDSRPLPAGIELSAYRIVQEAGDQGSDPDHLRGLDSYVYDALRAGASGFMLKDARPEEIAGAVRIVASGEALLAPAVTRTVVEEFARHPAPARGPPRAVKDLTRREREVLDLLVRGLSNPEICGQLVIISEATAKTHVARILQKLGLRDRIQAVIYAYENGLVTPGPPR
jgi:DNA-binding CsgD family transcriptional regulator